MPGIRASVRPQISRARLRLAVIALLALAAALAAIPLGGAQTMQDSGSQGETVSGRIVVRITPLASGDSDGAYRLTFGFLTEAILTSRNSLAAAIEANAALLPDSRTVPAAKLLQRAQQGKRNWVFSSPVRIPVRVGGGQAQTHLEGRVLVRVNPGRSGRFSIEFGFLPEREIGIRPGDSGGEISAKVQSAADDHALLPKARFLSSGKIAERVAAARRASSRPWVSSSVVGVPVADPLSVSAACMPLTIAARSSTTCEATVSGGAAPYSYSWSVADAARLSGAAPPSGAQRRFSQTFQNPGDYQVQVTVTDSAGQQATDVVSVRVTPPDITVRVTCSPDEVSAGAQVTCEAAASGGTPPYITYSWSVPGAIPPVGAGPSWSGQFANQDTHRVQVTVTDSARQSGPGEASVRVTVSPPTVRISCSPNEGGRPGVTCQAAASGGTPPYTYSWSAPGAVPPVGSGQTWNPSFSNAGDHRVQVTVTDSARQRADDSTSVTITPPLTVEASCTPEEVGAGDTVICWAQASGGTSPYTYAWSARGAVPPSGSDLVWRGQFANAGEYTVQVTVTDSARQQADDSVSVMVGGRIEVEVNCSGDEAKTGDWVLCWATPSGGAQPYTYSWSAQGASPSSESGRNPTWRTQFANAGTYSVQVTLTDNRRQQAEGQARVVVVPGDPLTVTASCSPTTIDEGGSTNCSARATGGAGGYTYEWRSGSANPSSGSGQSYRPRFDREGNYTVRVTVTDRDGADAEDSVRIEVEGGTTQPTVTASCRPTMIDEGDSTSCSASATGGAGGYTYEWRSGSANPSSGSGQSYRPRFDREGNYTVQVTAIDSRGARSTEDTVRIEVGPDTTQPLRVMSASCSPRTVDAGDRATCSAEATGGTPPYTYLWTAGRQPVSSRASFMATYQATTELRVTVIDSRNERASDTVRVTVTVTPPEVRITCPPKFVEGYSKECQARASGGTPGYTYSWRASGASPSSGSGERFSPSFSSHGRSYTVRVTVTDGSRQSASDTATVEVLEPPYIYHYARCGSGAVYYFDRDAPRKHHVAMPWETAQSVFPGWGESWIGVLSATSCARWPDGTDIRNSTDACRLGTPGANCR